MKEDLNKIKNNEEVAVNRSTKRSNVYDGAGK